jgi:hypothetical protein
MLALPSRAFNAFFALKKKAPYNKVILDDAEAAKMLSRPYREPWEPGSERGRNRFT